MGSKPKGPSANQQRAERLNLQLLQRQLRDSSKPVALPAGLEPLPPAPPPPPPPSATSADALEAGNDQRRKASTRTNAGRGTLFAGETGGYGGGNASLGGKVSLLG